MSLIIDGTNGVTFNDSSLQGAAASPYVLKNRIINGDMRIDQRNAGASTTPTLDQTYTLDRWAAGLSAGSKYSVQQNAGSVTPPSGFTNYLGVTSLSSYTVGASDYFYINQRIEGYNVSDLAYGTASAKTITLSFWVRSSLTGTFGGSVFNANSSYTYPFTYTILAANTWEQKSITIAGDTARALATTNGLGFLVSFGLGAGSTYSATAGSWQSGLFVSATGATSVVGTNGATFYITGVQLEIGTSATPFERRLYNQELANCQRYYWKNIVTVANAGFGLVGAFSSTTTLYCSIQYPVPMRTAPTITQSGTSIANGAVGSVVTSIPGATIGANGAVIGFTAGASFTIGQGGYVYGPTIGNYVDYTAEL
jgi:hypothetical protein